MDGRRMNETGRRKNCTTRCLSMDCSFARSLKRFQNLTALSASTKEKGKPNEKEQEKEKQKIIGNRTATKRSAQLSHFDNGNKKTKRRNKCRSKTSGKS